MTHHTGSAPDTRERPLSWLTAAICTGIDDHDRIFFDNTADSNEKAKTLCRRCPAIEPCLQAALNEEGNADAKNRYGIRGAQTKGQRRRAYEQRLTARQILDQQARKERFNGYTDLEVLKDLYEEYTVHSPDGHLIWTGQHPAVTVRDAFLVGVGREPVGHVQRSCTRELCFLPAHLTDRVMRDEQQATV
jgi:hypothetical protein